VGVSSLRKSRLNMGERREKVLQKGKLEYYAMFDSKGRGAHELPKNGSVTKNPDKEKSRKFRKVEHKIKREV